MGSRAHPRPSISLSLSYDSELRLRCLTFPNLKPEILVQTDVSLSLTLACFESWSSCRQALHPRVGSGIGRPGSHSSRKFPAADSRAAAANPRIEVQVTTQAARTPTIVRGAHAYATGHPASHPSYPARLRMRRIL
jgi:hypothetical protein